MNMGLLMALASLCVLVRAQLPPIKVNIVSALEPREVAPQENEEVILLPNLSSIVGLPTNNWIITAWVYIDASTTADSPILALLDGGVSTIFMQWPFLGAPIFACDDWTSQNPGEYSREVKKWFHMNMGSIAGTSYGAVTLRGSVTMVETTWQALIPLTSTTVIIASWDNTYRVISN